MSQMLPEGGGDYLVVPNTEPIDLCDIMSHIYLSLLK